MKNRLQFQISFECKDLHNEWTDKEWEELSGEIYDELMWRDIKLKINVNHHCKVIQITPITKPSLINNKE